MLGVVEVVVGAEEKVFEGEARGGGLGPRLETLPADGDGRVDADEDEEGAAEEGVQDSFSIDVGCYPAFAPPLGDKFEEVGGVCEGVFGLRLGDGFLSQRYPIFFSLCFSIGDLVLVCSPVGESRGAFSAQLRLKVKVSKAMVLYEILCYCALPSTNSYSKGSVKDQMVSLGIFTHLHKDQ